MKSYNTLYYLLCVILITGAFASMAQNSYGLIILGCVSISFSILFLIQFLERTITIKADIYSILEPFCLFILSSIFALRIFYISFPSVELIFAIASAALILIYFKKSAVVFTFAQSGHYLIFTCLLGFYLAIECYFISLASINISPQLSQITGMIAFFCVLAFFIITLISKKQIVNGEEATGLSILTRKKDNSVLILSLFLLFTLYRGFTTTGILPRMYSDEFPRTYFELVSKAETGKDSQQGGKFKYEKFKEKYDQFVNLSR
ncbi:MAG TPA: hypothetical protein VKR32_02050 [Puia sp.]|nr:hypothetical protein [Puia sp.]